MKQKKKSIKSNKNIFVLLLSSFVILVTVCISLNLFQKTKTENPNNLLIGVWQDTSTMGSGWSNRYHFYQNGSYSFVTSEMKCDRTTEQIDGTWKIDGDKLTLTADLTLERVDGKKIKSSGSCGTEYDLIDFTLNVIDTDSKISTLSISQFEVDTSTPGNLLKINIDNKSFWKFYDDANTDSPAPIAGNSKATEYFYNQSIVDQLKKWGNGSTVNTYTSKELRVMIYSLNQIKEIDNKIYGDYTTDKYGKIDGQFIQVFFKDPTLTLNQAITNIILKNYPKDKCLLVEKGGKVQIKDITRQNIDDAYTCPSDYSQTNGERYFTQIAEYPDRMLFVSYGQYGPQWQYELF